MVHLIVSEEEKKEEEEEWEPYIPEEPSPIRQCFYAKEENKFWLSMGDFDAGYLYECEFLDEEEKKKLPEDQLYAPTRAIPIHDSQDSPINAVSFR